jgi:hypothetical protein
MGIVSCTFLVESDDVAPVPVDDVSIRVFDAVDAFVTEGTTGPTPAGELILGLDGSVGGTSYTARFAKDGWSFPNGPNAPITVYDPPLAPPNDNNFGVTAHQGLIGQVVTFVVKDDQLVPEAVEDVQIRVFDDADTFLTEGLTDSNGELKLVLDGSASPGTEYILRLHKAGVEFPAGVTQRILVLDPLGPTESNIFDFLAHIQEIPESLDADMCLLSGYLVDAALCPLRSAQLRFHLKEEYPSVTISGLPYLSSPTLVRSYIIASEVTVTTDEEGYVEVSLPREAVFDFSIHGSENIGPSPLSTIYIPDRAGIDIKDVLFPYIQTVTYSESSVAIAVGESVEIEITGQASNLQPLTALDLTCLLEFTSGDETVATLSVTAEGNLLVTGVASGSTTLAVARREGTYAPRRPEIDDIIKDPDPLNVTVT